MSFETVSPHNIMAIGAEHGVEQKSKLWRVLLDPWIYSKRTSALLALAYRHYCLFARHER